MASLLEKLDIMEAAGFNQSRIDEYKNSQIDIMKAAGMSKERINTALGINNAANDDAVSTPMKKHWINIAKGMGLATGVYPIVDTGIKEWAVGKDAEWNTYFERAVGKSNINLAVQYHTSKKWGLDWEEAVKPEPVDTGAIERLYETIVGIGADFPTFLIGGYLGKKLTGNSFGTGFGAGYVNESVKGMYYEALKRKKVVNFKEWWEIYLKYGVSEGVKSGLTIGSIAAAPGAFGAETMLTKFLARYAALTGVGSIMDGHMPDKNTLVNNALLLATLGFGEKAGTMVFDKTIKNKKDLSQNTKELTTDIQMKEDAVSLNRKNFRNDKELDTIEIKKLNEELESLTKPIKVEPAKEKLKKEEAKPTLKQLEEKQQKTFDAIEAMRADKATGLEIDQAKFTALEKELGKVETAIKEFKPEVTGKVDVKEVQELKVEIARLEDLKTKDPNKIPMEEYITLDAKLTDAKSKLEILTKVEKPVEKEKVTIEQQVAKFTKQKRIEEIERRLEELEAPNIVETVENKIELKNASEAIKTMSKKVIQGKIPISSDINWRNNMARWLLDGLYPIWRSVKKAKKVGVKFKKDQPTPYEKARIQPGMIGRAMYFIKYNTLDFKTLKANGKGLFDIWLDVVEHGKEIADLLAKRRNLHIELRVLQKNGLLKKLFKPDKEKVNKIKQLKEEGRKLNALIKEKQKLPIDRNKTTEYGKANFLLIAKRVMELEERKIKTGHNIENAKQVEKELESEYGVMAKEMTEYHKRLAKYLVDSGVLSLKDFERMIELNKQYVPFNRVLEPLEKDVKPFSKTVQNPFKRIKGSEKTIVDPIETTFLNTLHFIQLAEANMTNTLFFKMIEDAKVEAKNQNLVDPFPDINVAKQVVKPIKITKEELKDVVIDMKEVTDTVADGLTIFRRNSQFLSDTQVAVYRDGKRTVYDVPSDMAIALKGMNRFDAGMIRKYFGWPSRWLRTGATLDPTFMARNFSRDTFYGAVFSKNPMFLPLLTTLRGLWLFGRHTPGERFRGTEQFKHFMKSGGMQSHLVSIDQRYFRDGKMLDQLNKSTNKLYNVILSPIENLRILSEFSEIASRLGDHELTMKRLIKQNKKLPKSEQLTEREMAERTGFEDRDLTIDFRKMGIAIQPINQTSAFYNARIQGNLKIYEGLRDRPAQVGLKIFQWIVLPTVALWLLNKDSERYKALPQWRKDLAWNLVVGEGTDNAITFSWPKAHALALIFGSLVERVLEQISNDDPEVIKNFIKEWGWESLVATIPIPDMFKPALEKWANKSLFTHRSLVPNNLLDVVPELQYTPYTTETAKFLGKIISNLTAGKVGSPIIIDNWVQGWTAGLGKHALTILDYALDKAGIVVPPIDPWSGNWIKNLSQMIVIKAFVVRHPSANSEHITKFWNTYKPLAKKLNSIKLLQKQRKFKESRHLFTKTEIELSFLEGYAETLRNNAAYVRGIYASNFMSAEQKSQMIEMVYLQMINTAKFANNMVLRTRKWKKKGKQFDKDISDDKTTEVSEELKATTKLKKITTEDKIQKDIVIPKNKEEIKKQEVEITKVLAQAKIADDEYYASFQKLIDKDIIAKMYFNPDDAIYPFGKDSGSYNLGGQYLSKNTYENFLKLTFRGVEEKISSASRLKKQVDAGADPFVIYKQPPSGPSDIDNFLTILHEARHKAFNTQPLFRDFIEKNNLDEEIFNRFMDLKFFSDIPSVKEKVLDWLNNPKMNGGHKEGYNGLKIKYDKAVSQILSKLKKQKNNGIIE